MHKPIIFLLLFVVSSPAFAVDEDDSAPSDSSDTTLAADGSGDNQPASQTPGAKVTAPKNTDKIKAPADTVTSDTPVRQTNPSTLTVEWGPFSPQGREGGLRDTDTGGMVRPSAIPRSSKRASAHPVVWKTDVEWVAANVGISTYGASANMSFVTLRWPNMYWDTLKFFGGAWKRTVHFFGTSTVGMPFWLSARHEFRIGTGISAGYLRFRQPITEDDSGFAGSGITAAKVKTYVSLPLEARYVYHHRRHLAFEVFTMVAFPMNYKIVFEANSTVDPEDYDADYRPFVFGGTGVRF